MDTLQEFKCPCCDGAISFDSTSQKLKCPYCDTEFDIETLASYNAELSDDSGGLGKTEWDTSPSREWQSGETDGLLLYICKSCGGEIVGDDTTAATSCPFCGNPVVMTEKVSGALKPDLVIPFMLDKKAAKESFSKYLSGKRLLPKIFKDENHIDDIMGVYVPFWLFDTKANARVRYRATRVRYWSDSRYNYTETSYYSVHRGGGIEFENVPVDGSTKMPDELMQSIEPYDISKAVDFKTAYLAGYLANKYDIDAEKCIPTANERVKRSTEEAFASTVQGYTSVIPENIGIDLQNGRIKYVLYPVWILNTTWNGDSYIFAMNGQTGKFVGNLPVDKAAATKWKLALTAAIGAGVYLGALLLNLLGII